MDDPRRTVDLETYLRSRRRILNEGGGRGYERGVRVFDCPLCGDTRGRGWIGMTQWGAGCFNSGCDGEPKLLGGVVEWVRRFERLASRTDAWGFLRRGWGTSAPIRYAVEAPATHGDFCRFPPGMRRFELGGSILQRVFEEFVQKQWGLSVLNAREWGLGWCMQGKYAWRVVIPVLMNHVPVGFQARTIHAGVQPKYQNSKYGVPEDPQAECGRQAASMLFNIDSVAPESEIVLVEGPGDVMAWHKGAPTRRPTAVALLGVALTPEKLGMLAKLRPERVIVALDNEPGTRERAEEHLFYLASWGLSVARGVWRGAKDAGGGATLEVQDF